MEVSIVLLWLAFSVVAGVIGSNRKIGFAGALAISIILSPLVGMIFAATSKDLQTDAFEKSVLRGNAGIQYRTIPNIDVPKVKKTFNLIGLGIAVVTLIVVIILS